MLSGIVGCYVLDFHTSEMHEPFRERGEGVYEVISIVVLVLELRFLMSLSNSIRLDELISASSFQNPTA